MMLALMRKEIRSCWPFAVPALLAQAWIALPVGADFDSDLLRAFDLWSLVGFVSIGLGVVLGLWQTLAESAQGTTPLLVHLVRNRARIVVAKALSALLIF